MTLKVIVRNLNVNSLANDLLREYNTISPETKVQDFISELAKDLNISDPSIDALCRGQILAKSDPLLTYSQNANEISIYLVSKSTLSNALNKREKPTSHEIYTLINSLNSLFRSRSKRNYLEVLLRDSSRINEVLSRVHQVKNDPISFGFLQNYDLVKYMMDQKRAESLLHSHPNIFAGLTAIVEYVREFYKKTPLDEKFTSKRSYSIDDASDEEEPTTASQGPQMQPVRSGPAISQEHFSAVLAMLNQQQRAQQPTANVAVPPAPRPTPQPQQPQSSQFLDRNQFQNLMQQIMSQQQQAATATPAPQTSSVSSEIAAKLEQMHEFGFFDDALNMRALEITEGNVEAAISLIIEGGDML